MFFSASLSLRSVNNRCLLGRYSHALWDMVADILTTVTDDFWPNLQLFISGRQDMVKYSIRSGWSRQTAWVDQSEIGRAACREREEAIG